MACVKEGKDRHNVSNDYAHHSQTDRPNRLVTWAVKGHSEIDLRNGWQIEVPSVSTAKLMYIGSGASPDLIAQLLSNR